MNQILETTDKTPIEIALGIDENGMTTARQLYEFLELNPSNYSKWLKRNVVDNEFATEGEDFHSYQMTSEGRGNFAIDYKLTSDFAKKLSMTAKNEKGEQARNYFVSIENKAKQTAIELNNLSPELRLLIQMETQQKEQAKQIEEVKSEVRGIRDVVAINHIDWREETSKIMRKIGNTLDGGYQEVRTESYGLLEKRMGVNLKQRLTNKRRRQAENGVCQSSRDKLNYLDVINEDKKLIEGYVAIVKELAIKYGVA